MPILLWYSETDTIVRSAKDKDARPKSAAYMHKEEHAHDRKCLYIEIKHN